MIRSSSIILIALLALGLLAGCQCGGSPSVLDLSTPWGDLDIGGSGNERLKRDPPAAPIRARPAPPAEPTASVDP